MVLMPADPALGRLFAGMARTGMSGQITAEAVTASQAGPEATERGPGESVLGLVQVTAVNLHPRLDILSQPYLALGQVSDRLRKIGTARDLVRPLATDSTETDSDLVRAHEADRLHSHMIDRRRGTISLLSS